MAYHATAQRRIDNHLCMRCEKPLPENWQRYSCEDCNKEMVLKNQIRNKDRKKTGSCRTCGEPAIAGLTRCQKCRESLSKRAKKLREGRIANGVCQVCGNSESLISTRKLPICEVCYFKERSLHVLKSPKYWEMLKEKLEAQNYRCAYTGIELILGVNDSADHIFPSSRFPHLETNPDNIQWVCRIVNFMKRDYTPDEFLTIIQRIAESSGQPINPVDSEDLLKQCPVRKF